MEIIVAYKPRLRSQCFTADSSVTLLAVPTASSDELTDHRQLHQVFKAITRTWNEYQNSKIHPSEHSTFL